ncbi:Aldo/keto reductase [Cryphonectria parasitica EP155]|uniref:Aldo/keto reductase n=1 Tax=Cryphonectria parasitica (strain ATCC 38755 / EP155) TaxID=660469 RepID=A0A9P4XSP5_CRYP1|nr:Aldo/keto reductase [Cryphonectria parasitica EP155]KAF3760045.1 Aldo/keto reductase [Cryphonectria parasitica EP155]
MTAPKLVFGAGTLMKSAGYNTAEEVKPVLEALAEYGDLFTELDTAAAYGESEEYLGQVKAASQFTIHTKARGMRNPSPSTKEVIIAEGKESLCKLGVDQVDIYFMHCPDLRVPLEETLAGIDSLYQSGAFRRFGLSNYTAEQVEEVIRVCNSHGYVLPSAYQGNYNAVACLAEDELLPLLRRHGIAFYAYSPIAGGFLAKKSAQLRQRSLQGRWESNKVAGQIYYAMYADRPGYLEALDQWHEIAAAEGVTAAEMAYRWVVHNSVLDAALGDAVIVGPRNPEQIREIVAWIQKGPLSQEAAIKIETLWGPLKEHALPTNLEAFNMVNSRKAD